MLIKSNRISNETLAWRLYRGYKALFIINPLLYLIFLGVFFIIGLVVLCQQLITL